MMSGHRRITVVLIVTALLLSLGLSSAIGYIEQRQTQVLLSGPNVVRCDRAATIQARVVSTKSGRPIANQVVRWSIVGAGSPGDGLSATSTITNRRGKTSVRLTFGPVRGPRTVQAGIAGGAPTITIRCAGGLPRTSAIPPAGHVELPSAALLDPMGAAFVSPAEAPARPLTAAGLRVDRLGIDLPIVPGDGFTVPLGAAAHYPGTAVPGEGSNSFLYAHARAGHFLELWRVRSGDRVEVDMADGSVAVYEVSEIHPLVPWDALEYLAPTRDEILTLQTCLTYQATAPRFVVIARRLVGA